MLTLLRNNIVKGSLIDLELEARELDSLLNNPQEYLKTLSVQDARRIREVLVPAYQRTFKIIFYLGASLAAVAFFVAFFLMPHIDLACGSNNKPKEEDEEYPGEKSATTP